MSSAIVEVLGQQAKLTANNNAGISKVYGVTGVENAEDAIEATTMFLISVLGSPPSLGALVLDQVTCKEENLNYFICTASWKTFARRSPAATGDSEFSFQMGLQPAKIRHAIGGIETYKKSGVLDWSPQLINDVGDGETPDGVDIWEPTYEETTKIYGPTAGLTVGYRNTLKSMVGRTNISAFKGWAPGEVLLQGVTGSRRGADDSELVFSWGCGPIRLISQLKG